MEKCRLHFCTSPPPPTLGAGVANSDMKHGLTHKRAWRLSASFIERMFYTHYRNVRKAMSNLPHAKPRDSQSHAKLVYRKCDCSKLSVQLDRDVNGTRTAAFVFAPGPALRTRVGPASVGKKGRNGQLMQSTTVLHFLLGRIVRRCNPAAECRIVGSDPLVSVRHRVTQ